MSTPLPAAGDRVRMTGLMPQDPAPLPVGTEGTVTETHADVDRIHVDWDNGSRLILLVSDPFEVVAPAKPTCLNCDGTGKAARGWGGGVSADGQTCPDCRGTGVDTTPYGVGGDHCPHCGADWKQPHDQGCLAYGDD